MSEERFFGIRIEDRVLNPKELRETIVKEIERLTEMKELLDNLDKLSGKFRGLAERETTVTLYESLAELSGYKPYEHMKQIDAARQIIKRAEDPEFKGALSATEVTRRLEAGGLQFNAQNPRNSVFVLLDKLAKDGELERVRDGARTYFRYPKSGDSEEPPDED